MSNFSWFNNAKIYQILIDRFAGTDNEYEFEDLRSGFLHGNIKVLFM